MQRKELTVVLQCAFFDLGIINILDLVPLLLANYKELFKLLVYI